MDALPEPRRVDLHLHTTWSDGRWTPRRVVEEAHARGLSAISVTDHDVLGGLAEAGEAARERGLAFLTGVELTAEWDGRTAHILGYGVDPDNGPLGTALQQGRAAMTAHVKRVLAAVHATGESLTRTDLEKYRARYAGGASLILAMVERGIVRRASDGGALLRLAAAEPRAYTASDAMRMIHGAGGVAVLAHPARLRPGGTAGRSRGPTLLTTQELAPLVAAGLDGLEVWNVVHGPRERRHYHTVAEELDLVISGGSDCHGTRDGLAAARGEAGEAGQSRRTEARIGRQHVPYAVYELLSRAIATRRQGPGGAGRTTAPG